MRILPAAAPLVPLVFLPVLALSCRAGAQSPDGTLPEAPQPQVQNADAANSVTLRNLPLDFVKDQGAIWSSPARVRVHDLKWIVPLGLATTVAITTDHQVMSSEVSHDADFNHSNVLASDVMTGVFIAAPVALFGDGQLEKDDEARESGILSSEALLDGLVVEQGMKLIFWRERPSMDQAKGKFFQTNVGTDSSFPSSHSVLSWSSAAVLAAEYPSGWQPFAIYTLATGVSLTRVLGEEHFPSDVIVGSAVGWMIGHYVYRRHHRNSPPA